MWIRKLLENLRNFWDVLSERPIENAPISPPPSNGSLPPEVKKAMGQVKKMREDRDAPNLFVGKIIDDGNVKCEVVSCEKEDFRIKILEINWQRLGTYMDLGKIYSLCLCDEFEDFIIWEVDPGQMKRNTSQVLLAWERGSGWTWDLDM